MDERCGVCYICTKTCMSETENRLRNEFKNRSKARRKVRTSGKKRRRRFKLPEFRLKHTRLTKILGLFCLLVSLFLLVALISYLFTWKQDQSYEIGRAPCRERVCQYV